MNNRLQELMASFAEKWSQLSFSQKILVPTMILTLLFASGFLFNQAQDSYEVLYSNLSVEDAAAVVTKLKEQKVNYKVTEGGTTILVAKRSDKTKDELVLETAAELTGEQTINLTEIPPVVQGEVQKEMIKKLNTDAIVRVLKNIRGIKNAQVIVSQPEYNVFSDDQELPTASVMLMVDPGFRLRDEQVKTIKSLVAHAVPGLKMENVIIADNAGNPLEGTGSVAAGGATTENDTRRKRFEEETRKKVLGILAPVVGKENVVVSVSAMLNFDETSAQIHRMIPTGGTAETPTGLAVSQQEQTEEYTGGNKKPVGGEPGVETNASPTYQGQDQSESKKGDYRFVKKTTNFVNSEEKKSVVYAPGTVERMTIAVVLNKVLTAQETDELRDAVANAAGADYARGDSVDVKGFQFTQLPSDDKALTDAAKDAQNQTLTLQIASMASVVLLGLAALSVFYLLFRRPAEGEVVEEDIEEVYSLFEEDEPEQLLESIPIPIIEAKLDPEMEHMREAINNAVTEDPAEAARVLMTYMKEM